MNYSIPKLSLILLAVCLLATLTIGCMESQDARFDRLSAEGGTYFARRAYSEALAAWRAAAAIRPGDGNTHLNLGNTYLKLANLTRAVEAFQQAAANLPTQAAAHHELAKLYLISGNLSEAEPLIQTLVETFGDTPTPHLLQGDLEMLKGNPDLAEQHYRHAAAIPGRADFSLVKLALSLLAQENPVAADDAYRQAAALNTGDIDTLVQMYHYQQFKGDSRQAEALLQEAIRLEPEDLSLQMELAEFFVDTGQNETACRTLAELIPMLPDPISAQKLFAEILMMEGRMAEAEAVLDVLPGIEAKDAELETLRGKFHLLSSEYTAAVGAFKSALQLAPNTPLTSYLLGVTFLADGRNHLARKNLTDALSLDPLFTDADLLLADLYYKGQEYEFAAEHARRIVMREPENFRAHQILGNIRAAQGAYDDALKIMEAAQKLSPESPIPLYHMAMIAENEKKPGEALSFYRRLLSAQPDLVDAISRFTLLLVHLGKTNEAVKFIENAIDRHPENALLYQILGEVHLAAGNIPKAIEFFNSAIRLEPNATGAYIQLSNIYGTLSDFKEQKKILDSCVEAIPSCVQAYIKLADIHRREWNFAAAADTLKSGLMHTPGDPWMTCNLAWIYLEQDRNLNEALSLAQSAFEQLPGEAAAGDTLGWAFYKKGLPSQAVWILKEVAAKAPEDPFIYYHLGMAYLAADDLSAAEKNINQAIASGLGSPYRETAEAALNQKKEDPHSDEIVIDIPALNVDSWADGGL